MDVSPVLSRIYGNWTEYVWQQGRTVDRIQMGRIKCRPQAGASLGSMTLARSGTALLWALLWACWLASAGVQAGGGGSVFRQVACPAEVRASRCGFVTAPLGHAHPSGPQIELFVAVQGAAAPGKLAQLDPVFYLEGGPGARGSLALRRLAQVFPERDLVGIDQRGVGRSVPALDCPGINALLLRQDVAASAVAPLFLRALAVCGTALRAQGVRLELFDTTQAALDVETVKRALGYRQINLYGSSYGTRLAQEVLRRTPAHLRAVVLDSVIPASIDRVAQSPLAAKQALGRVFAACAASVSCRSHYTGLAATYREALDQLAAAPLRIVGSAGRIDAQMFQSRLVSMMYTRQGVSELPGLIAAAHSGDAGAFDSVATQPFGESLSDALSWGAFYANECSGEVAYSTPARLSAGLDAAPEFAGALSLVAGISSRDIFQACASLHLTRPAPLENTAVRSGVPVLLLAGEFDPVTPPEWLPAASSGLSHAYPVVVKGAAHGPGLTTECGLSLATAFITDPTQALEKSCANQGLIRFR